jgi:protein phosphatase
MDALMQLIQEIDWEIRGKEGNAACTLALLWLLGERAHVITVGDSQIFRVRHGEMEQVSPKGVQRAALRVYMGMGPALSVGAHQWHGEVFTGDIFVLTTDGVTSLLQPAEMMERFWLAGTSVRGAAEAIIDEVDRRGGPDDATVLLVDVLALNDLEGDDA